MKTQKKTTRFADVRYDVLGPVTAEAMRMEAAGESVIKLNIGNPASFGFSAPADVIEKMKASAYCCQGYSDAKGLTEAREAITAYSGKKGITGISAEDVYTGNGVSELIQITLDALLNPGDEILIPSPDYPLWTAAATFAGGKVVHYVCSEESDWYPNLEDMERKITERTKALVVINPNNPTGAVYPAEILAKIADLARRHGLIIFADEIYDRLLADGEKHTSIASVAEDVLCITMNGLSKSHMLCGYRAGWMVISGNREDARDYIEGIDMLVNMRLCSNVTAQSLIPEALSGYCRAEEYFGSEGRINVQNELAYSLLNGIPGVTAVRPRAAFYIFPKIDAGRFGITDDREFVLDFLKKEKVLIVPGSGFNWSEPDHCRIVCLPDSKLLTEAVSRLGHYLSVREKTCNNS